MERLVQMSTKELSRLEVTQRLSTSALPWRAVPGQNTEKTCKNLCGGCSLTE